MATSGTYTFGSLPSEQVIVDAYERIGVLPDIITAQQIFTAQRTINFLLTEWINKGLNLWTVKQEMLGLNPNQNTYALPQATSDILEATIRTSVRQLGGTAFASSGIAQNAFDSNSATACTQTAPDGNIGYTWGQGVSYAIQMVGIQSNANLTYTLVAERSNDNITWSSVLNIPADSYPVGQIVWAVIPVPIAGQYFRIRETGGATLDIQELYFDTTLNDIPITRISRSEYISLPIKNQVGRPTSFYVDRQIDPAVVYLWPTPTPQYNNLFYTRVRMPQDVGAMLDNAEIPSRFLEPLTAGLAWKLALKYVPQKALVLKADYEESYNTAAREDRERVPLRIYGDYMQGWASE